MRGRVGKLLSNQGYGFIVPEGESKEIFFHRSELRGRRFEEVRTGLRVEFELALDPRNPRRFRAIRVQCLEGA